MHSHKSTSILFTITSWLLAALLNLLFTAPMQQHGAVVLAAPVCDLVPPKSARQEDTGGTSMNSNGDDSGDTTFLDALVTGWYPGWLSSQVPPSSLSLDKYTQLTYAFALTTPDSSVISLNSDDQQVLPQFVQAVQAQGVKALVSIGGWTGSQYFSSAVATPENRTAFVKAVADLASNYKLDGIDFDWEYPNKQGIGCNLLSPNDADNFLSFLQELKQDPVGTNLILSAAVGISPFNGPDGTPMKDVSGFAEVLDHISIMAYDIWGPWSNGIGPNAPLDDSCAPTKVGSAKSAVEAWKTANFPTNKISLGVAAYGHSFRVPDSNTVLDSSGNIDLYSAFTKNMNSLVPSGDAASVDVCGNPTSGGTDVYDIKQMVTAGFLGADGLVASGIDYTFDNCSQTPFVLNPNSGVVISYDDATSFDAKGKFITDNGLKGFAMWHVAGDNKDVLLDAITKARDINATCPT